MKRHLQTFVAALAVAGMALAGTARGRFAPPGISASDIGWTSDGSYTSTLLNVALAVNKTLYFNAGHTIGIVNDDTDLKIVGSVPLTPSSDQAINLGKASVRWSNLFATGINLGVSGALTDSATAPTISSGFGTSPSVTAGGATAFRINVGTGGTANSGVIGLPAATNGWNCDCTDITTKSATVFLCKQTAGSTTSATVGNYDAAGAAAAWAASDILAVKCRAF